jgi:hypothetical protein
MAQKCEERNLEGKRSDEDPSERGVAPGIGLGFWSGLEGAGSGRAERAPSDDATAADHEQGGGDGMQFATGGEGHADEIVECCEPEIAEDGLVHGARRTDGVGEDAQVAAAQDGVGGGGGEGSSGIEGNPEVTGAQGWGVIDAIADKADRAVSGAESLEGEGFIDGAQARLDGSFRVGQKSGSALRGITGQDLGGDAQVTQFGEGSGSGISEAFAHGGHADEVTIEFNEDELVGEVGLEI